MSGSAQPAAMIVSIVIIWALWQILRIASGVEAIASELRRLREIAQERRR